LEAISKGVARPWARGGDSGVREPGVGEAAVGRGELCWELRGRGKGNGKRMER